MHWKATAELSLELALERGSGSAVAGLLNQNAPPVSSTDILEPSSSTTEEKRPKKSIKKTPLV